MNPRDIPPNVFINSFLKSAADVGIEAAVVYTVEKNGKCKTAITSNDGAQGVARAANHLKFGEGAIERAAIALHEFRIKFAGDVSQLPEDVKAEMAKCYICREDVPWDKLDEPDRHGHRVLAIAAISAACVGVATEPGAPSVIV